MIREILQLISIFDIQIELLQKGNIQEIKPWQKLENQLITQLEKTNNKHTLSQDLYQIFNTKLKKKHYLVEPHLSVSRKLFSALSNSTNLYDSSGKAEGKNFISIVDKRI